MTRLFFRSPGDVAAVEPDLLSGGVLFSSCFSHLFAQVTVTRVASLNIILTYKTLTLLRILNSYELFRVIVDEEMEDSPLQSVAVAQYD